MILNALAADGVSLHADHLAHAAGLLSQGQLVAFPTETVYGLGANACDARAVAKIFAAKGRPSDHPLIVHVANPSQVGHFAAQVAPYAERLMAEYWPGPLTVILPRRSDVATASAGGQTSIGLRCPDHAVALALLRRALALGVHGVSAPSANRFGRVSPTTALHVQSELGPDVCVLDAGPCSVGIESTIVDATGPQPVLLRPGMLTLAQLAAACGQTVLLPEQAGHAMPRASGTLAQHYAPNAKLRLMSLTQIQTALDVLGPDTAHMAVYARGHLDAPLRTQSSRVWVRRMPFEAGAVAQQLFAVLREFDDWGAKLIWVEAPPLDAEWAGVADRLARAAA